MTHDITPLVRALITLCTVLITTFVIPWIKRKTDSESLTELMAWAELGVAAAEQLYLSTEGAKKKEYVLEFLASKGFDVNTLEIENAIEAAVLDLHTALYGVTIDAESD